MTGQKNGRHLPSARICAAAEENLRMFSAFLGDKRADLCYIEKNYRQETARGAWNRGYRDQKCNGL
jgi:hypothetical protein